MPVKLTERQNQIYEFIRSHLQDEGIPPTVDEIRQRLALVSTSGVHKHLVALEKKGVLVRIPNVSRGLRLLAKEGDAFANEQSAPSLPLIPQMAASQPGLLRRGKEFIKVDLTLFPQSNPDACLVGRAGDDGMAEEGIHKGDYLVIEETGNRSLESGTLVAAFVNATLMVRRVEFGSSRVEFVPKAKHYTTKSFVFGSPAYYVIGPVRTVLRRL